MVPDIDAVALAAVGGIIFAGATLWTFKNVSNTLTRDSIYVTLAYFTFLFPQMFHRLLEGATLNEMFMVTILFIIFSVTAIAGLMFMSNHKGYKEFPGRIQEWREKSR